MVSGQSKGNFIIISPNESIQKDISFPIATFNILGVGEEDTTEYYPIMSNFYDTVYCLGTGTTLYDVNGDTVPSQTLPYIMENKMVNKIISGITVYWLSKANDDSLIYIDIETGAKITISTTDNWNTYTVNKPLS